MAHKKLQGCFKAIRNVWTVNRALISRLDVKCLSNNHCTLTAVEVTALCIFPFWMNIIADRVANIGMVLKRRDVKYLDKRSSVGMGLVRRHIEYLNNHRKLAGVEVIALALSPFLMLFMANRIPMALILVTNVLGNFIATPFAYAVAHPFVAIANLYIFMCIITFKYINARYKNATRGCIKGYEFGLQDGLRKREKKAATTLTDKNLSSTLYIIIGLANFIGPLTIALRVVVITAVTIAISPFWMPFIDIMVPMALILVTNTLSNCIAIPFVYAAAHPLIAASGLCALAAMVIPKDSNIC